MLLTDEIPQTDITSVAGPLVSHVSTDAAFADLRDEWNRLAGDIPFKRWEWLESWWRFFGGSDDELCLLCVHNESGQLIGLAPWYVENSTIDGRIVRFLGSGRVCSDYLTILAADGQCESVAKLLANWMIDESGFPWDAIEFDGIAADDPTVTAFLAQLKTRNYTIHKTAGLSCWRIALPAGWDSYLKCLSKSHRERVRQLHRRQFGTGRAVTHRANSASEVRDGFNILVDLHQRRRESLGQSGCFSEPAFGSFLSETALRFFDLGRLRLQWVELEGRPVAAQIDFAGAETSYHYQSGIDPTIPRERPGWLGTSAALKYAVEEGFTHFDFLRGDETYKSHWQAEPVETFNIRIAGDSTSSRLRHEIWTIQQRLKSWVKSRFRRV